MEDFNFINLNRFTWYLNIAIIGAVFAIFSLMYNDYYIYYGLITFIFGVSSHAISKFFDWVFKDDDDKYYWIFYVSQLILIILWISIAIYIYL
ncbi:MAG: hypothetical protein QG589_340 [Patescibacteria group bacterium]|nr:hypothetical protein [Patescibacteria group bacterium]